MIIEDKDKSFRRVGVKIKGSGEEVVPQLADGWPFPESQGKYESVLLLTPCPPTLLPWETMCCSRSTLMEGWGGGRESTFLPYWDGVYR